MDSKGMSKAAAAAKAGMGERTAREYRKSGKLPSEKKKTHDWRTRKDPFKEVYFSQVHKPGRLAESDFTDMAKLGVTVGRAPFPHLLYHFTLTYSNWEWATICSQRTGRRRLICGVAVRRGPAWVELLTASCI